MVKRKVSQRVRDNSYQINEPLIAIKKYKETTCWYLHI